MHGCRNFAALADESGKPASGGRLGVEVVVAMMSSEKRVDSGVDFYCSLLLRQVGGAADQLQEFPSGARLRQICTGAEATIAQPKALLGLFADARPEFRPEQEHVVSDDWRA